MVKLMANTVLRNPTSGQVEVLLEGAELPEWAKGLISNPDLIDDVAEDCEGEAEEPELVAVEPVEEPELVVIESATKATTRRTKA